ncbi:unnamed protein product [Tilletia controversa]|nr:unnamed protein product [Tilletia controversa]
MCMWNTAFIADVLEVLLLDSGQFCAVGRLSVRQTGRSEDGRAFGGGRPAGWLDTDLLARLLSSAGIVLRPSRQPNEDGEIVYEARYADEDDSEEDVQEGGGSSSDETPVASRSSSDETPVASRSEEVKAGEKEKTDAKEESASASGSTGSVDGTAAKASSTQAEATKSDAGATEDAKKDDAMAGVESTA